MYQIQTGIVHQRGYGAFSADQHIPPETISSGDVLPDQQCNGTPYPNLTD